LSSRLKRNKCHLIELRLKRKKDDRRFSMKLKCTDEEPSIKYNSKFKKTSKFCNKKSRSEKNEENEMRNL